MRVLFTNSGRRTYLVHFALQLMADGYPLELFVSDCVESVPTFHVSPDVRALLTPPVRRDKNLYGNAILDLVETHGIDAVIPLSDLDLDVLANLRGALAERGATAVVSTPEVIDRCTDKRAAHDFCRANGIPVPESHFTAAGYDGPFPCIRKHVRGSGSSGLAIVRRESDLADFEEGRDMIQTLVSGTEYGLDILNDLEGRFVSACVKEKILMRSGETDRARVVRHENLEVLARRIGEKFRHAGNLDVDVMEDAEGGLYCIDFNPRFGGGYPATHIAGMNYLRSVLDMTQDKAPDLPDDPRYVTVMKGVSLFWYEGAT